jgi:hypothetical protein
MKLMSTHGIHSAILVSLLCLATRPDCISAEKTSTPATESAPLPDYPRVNLAPDYEVLPGWPQRPANAERAAVASVLKEADLFALRFAP